MRHELKLGKAAEEQYTPDPAGKAPIAPMYTTPQKRKASPKIESGSHKKPFKSGSNKKAYKSDARVFSPRYENVFDSDPDDNEASSSTASRHATPQPRTMASIELQRARSQTHRLPAHFGGQTDGIDDRARALGSFRRKLLAANGGIPGASGAFSFGSTRPGRR